MARIMGVVDVTPEVFSDGGGSFDPGRVVARGRALFAEGADVVDLNVVDLSGVGEADQGRLVLPVVEELSASGCVCVSTARAAVARAALARAALGAGARMLRDTTGELWPLAVDSGAGWIGVHGPVEDRSAEVVAEVTADLVSWAERASAAGVSEVWIDPGIGCAKTAEHDLTLLAHLGRLVATGWPVAVGAGFGEGLEGSLATVAWSVAKGAAMVRVHDVAATAMAIRLFEARGVKEMAEVSA